MVFLCCSKFASSLCYCTPMSDSYQMKLTISSLKVLPISPVSQCMKFSCTTLLCLIARGRLSRCEEIFRIFIKWGMKTQLFATVHSMHLSPRISGVELAFPSAWRRGYSLNYNLWRTGAIKGKSPRTVLLIFAPQVCASL